MDIIQNPKLVIEQLIKEVNKEQDCINKKTNLEKLEFINSELIKRIKLEENQITDINTVESYEELYKLNNQLVQYTGQIQDIFENLMKVQAFVNVNNEIQYTEFGELDEESLNKINENGDCQIFQDRKAMLVVPIQGLANWVMPSSDKKEFSLFNHKQQGFLPSVLYLDLLADQEVKINSLVKVIGIIELRQEAPPLQSNNDGFDANFEDNYPINKVPRINCLSFQVLNQTQLVDSILTKIQLKRSGNLDSSQMIFNSFIKNIFQDQDFSQMIILSLIQSQYLQQHGQYLGKTIFNINQCQKLKFTYKDKKIDFVQIYEQICKRFHIKCKVIQVDNQNLSKISIDGVKNYDKNILEFGETQLTDETFLILDETKLKEGNLCQKTIKNLQSIQRLLQSNQTNLDFQFQQISNDLNVNSVILSYTRSLLEWDMEIVVREGEIELKDQEYEILFKEDDELDEESRRVCDVMRVEIIEAQREIKKVEIDTSVGKQISDNFVSQGGDPKINKGENLQRQLQLGKCLTAMKRSRHMEFEDFVWIQEKDNKSRKVKK